MVNIQDLPPELLTRIIFFIAPPRGPLLPSVAEYLKARLPDQPRLSHEVRLPHELTGETEISANAQALADMDDASEPSEDHASEGAGWEDDLDDKKQVYSRPHRNLRNVCLVSRLFRDLAQPFLFYSFDDTGLSGPLVQTVSFARTIYTRPELGKHVRELDIMYPLDGNEMPMPLSGEDATFFTAAIKSLRLGEQEQDWISGLTRRVDLSVLTALLVNQTPHLRVLCLPGEFVRMGPLDHLMNLKPTLLSELQSFSFEGEDEFLGIDIASHHRLFTLPKLNEVDVTFANLLDKTFPASWAPGTLGVEKAGFRRCHMDLGGLRRFMQACKVLKSFSYNSFLSAVPRPSRKPGFNAEQAYEAILSHKDTLEHFELVFAGSILDMESFGEQVTDLGKLGSFRDFPVLESLIIGHALLPPHPQLPPSLKKFYIEDCNTSIREMVDLIADDCKKGLYPNLTVFKVFSSDITEAVKLPGQVIPAGKTPEQCFSSLRDLFKDTKVDFIIAPYRMWDLDAFMDYDDYEDEDDMDFDDEMDLNRYEFQLGEGFGPGRPGGNILDDFHNLIRAIGYTDSDHDTDRSWVTEEDDEDMYEELD